MSIFFNFSDDPIEGERVHMLSADAGAEVTRALELLMRSLQSYETRRSEQLDSNLQQTAYHFRLASKIFSELEHLASDTEVAIPTNLQAAWEAAYRFTDAIGQALNRKFAGLPLRPAYPGRLLMSFAGYLTDRMGEAVEKMEPNPRNPLAGRQIATQAMVLQVFGVLIAEMLSEIPRPEARVAVA